MAKWCMRAIGVLTAPVHCCAVRVDQVIPSLADVEVWPLLLVMLVVNCTNVVPLNVQFWNSALRPLGIVTFVNVMFLNTGRL